MSGKQAARFAVVITKESVEEWTVYVSADSPEEAKEAAADLFQNCVEPTRIDENQGMVCAVCLKTVQWTGIAADDPENRSGKTIPRARGFTRSSHQIGEGIRLLRLPQDLAWCGFVWTTRPLSQDV